MWEDIEMDPERIPMLKLVFHSLQIVLGFVTWCLNIAVFRADKAKIAGNGWTFGVVSTPRIANFNTPESHPADLIPRASSSSRSPPGSTS